MDLLNYISNDQLLFLINEITQNSIKKKREIDENMKKNVLDPFSAIFECLTFNFDFDEWVRKEKTRQIQKTMQNMVGEFHQNVLGSIPGWENLKNGKVIDLECRERKIIAEVKNKHNTTKGDQKKSLYENFEKLLNTKYIGYTAYYVEIIPNKKDGYDEEFVPSDNILSVRKMGNPKIRKISGQRFYELVTGDPYALKKLYEAIPKISEILGKNISINTRNQLNHIFNSAYSFNSN
ncbi:Eco47II family restriction endonuclease [Silvanigrella aquatica]|uniref:Restriction endonuclease n=1 Tax=Silvanigrella aquatica TaxID=1915309 RepID=A0A1L4D3T5_9BACT|nr:Eco47II family restriction endonuclease [Silvanigrella aquatica]APJ04876.1 hypothetical protein AXG55_13630 [Silvanigrella aquatica]